MPRMYRRPRTSSQLRDQLLKQLENDAAKLLKQMASDFSASLAQESQRALKDALAGLQNGDFFNSQSFGNMLTASADYMLNRPRTRTNTQESARSRATEQQFRLSRAQEAAEASATLARGDKNT